MNEQMTEMQNQGIEQMKSVQTQIAEFNERIADTVVGAMPDVPTPFSDYVPSPREMVKSYFDFMGEVRNANREFVERVVTAWDREPTAAAK